MSPLILGRREAPRLPLDLSPLTPERLASLSVREIAEITLSYGNTTVHVGDLFAIRDGERETIVIEGGGANLDRVGSGMSRGHIRILGDVGALLGLSMTGGMIEVEGSAGSFAACDMRGGHIAVAGDMGDFAASAAAGYRFGMRGGLLRVRGRIGDRAGDRMRRGLLLVEGDAGDFTGAFMLAGTIIVRGAVGHDPGYAMRRGTLFLDRPPSTRLATFLEAGRQEAPWVALLERYLRTEGIDPPFTDRVFLRLLGCGSVGGLGEILLPAT